MVAAAIRPVCLPMTTAQLHDLHPHFDDREDHDLVYLKIYQRRGGVPFECKTWISRQLLF
jgi:hypothetical protein